MMSAFLASIPVNESLTVIDVEDLVPVNVSFGTAFTSIGLDVTVDITLNDLSIIAVPVVWGQSGYNENVPGLYVIIGTITLPYGVINTGGLVATKEVTVDVDVSGGIIASAAPIAPITVPNGTAFGSLTLPAIGNVTLNNGSVISVDLSWAAGSYNGSVAATYNLLGTPTNLPVGVTNPGNAIKANINVTVQAVASDPEDGVQVKKVLGGGSGAPLGFLQFLPNDYSQTVIDYPCFIYLHGAGAKGSGNSGDLDKVANEQVPKSIKNGWNAQVNGFKFIVISPQTPKQSETAWLVDGVPFIDWLLNSSGLRIDLSRLYLGGWSMGACGAIKIAANATSNNPNKYAAIVSGATSAGSTTDGQGLHARGVKCWFFSGDSDAQAPLNPVGQRVPNAMITAGANVLVSNAYDVGNVATDSIFTIISGGTHSSTADRAFRITNSNHDPNSFEWLLTKTLT